MKTFNIEIPKGYEIDKEKSTFETIIFKEVKNELPKTWAELEKLKGYYVTTHCNITPIAGNICKELTNVFATKMSTPKLKKPTSLCLAPQVRARHYWLAQWHVT